MPSPYRWITSGWYDGQKLIAPEHAILDDNGDGWGTRLFVDETVANSSADGELAKRTYLKDIRFPDHIPKAWVREYRTAIGRVEAATANRRIREEDIDDVEKEDVKIERQNRPAKITDSSRVVPP